MSYKKVDQFFDFAKKYFQVYLGISIIVFLFILFFQPFAIAKFEFETKLLFYAGFGLIILVFMLLNQVLFHNLLVQPSRNQPNDHLLFSLYHFSLTASTGLAFIFYIQYVGKVQVNFGIVAKVIFICISLPFSIHLYEKLSLYKNRLKALRQENQALQDKLRQFSETYANRYIELISEKDADNFRVLVSKILFARSADNYVEIGYLQGDEVRKKLIRNTLRNIEKQLREFNNFVRTHRTSLVNIQYVHKLNKNFQSYWLSLDNTTETIPVSRQYLMAVKDLV